jgi:hypothetical protein
MFLGRANTRATSGSVGVGAGRSETEVGAKELAASTGLAPFSDPDLLTDCRLRQKYKRRTAERSRATSRLAGLEAGFGCTTRCYHPALLELSSKTCRASRRVGFRKTRQPTKRS